MRHEQVDGNQQVPTRILFAVNDPGIEQSVRRGLEQSGDLQCRFVERLNDPSLHQTPAPDALVIWYNVLRRSSGVSPSELLQISRRMPVIVAMTRETLLEAAEVLDFADAWMFIDDDLDHLSCIVRMSQVGYCLVPHFIGPNFTPDHLRAPLVERLTTTERRVLRELGNGYSNSLIANRLGVTEATVKWLVRCVLSKLRLRNRTAAAVFATSLPLDGIGATRH